MNAQHWALGKVTLKKKNKEKDTQQDIITSKICLYGNTTTNIMKREKKLYLLDKQRHNYELHVRIYL
jgi:hypothetical protein